MSNDSDDQFSKPEIGRRLQHTRQALGVGQTAFAERARISATAYNQYETGKKRPSIENAIALCDTYGLTLDWIFRGDPSNLRYELADTIKALRQVRNQQ
jgi:transcriptional regulator with XRE-family HTH domain